MKNSLGNPARGEAFYPRDKEVKKIFNVLESGASIYLEAPRRVGKTSILKHLEDNPSTGFYFAYVITESVYEENNFYKTIFEDLLKTKAIQTLAKASRAVKDLIGGLLSNVKSIQGVELREGEDPDYYKLLVQMLSHISDDYGRLIIMIDEFPQTIQNILETSGEKYAKHFLQRNRELRHEKSLERKVSFIYTGSVSLVPLVEKITSLTSINDIETIEVNPLTRIEAFDFLVKLMEGKPFKLEPEIIDYILDRIKWFIPFHLQLIQQEIVDVHETTGKEIDKGAVDKAFDQMIHTRNKPQFEPYFSRLNKLFKGKEHDFVMEILKFTALNEVITDAEIHDLSVKYAISNTKYIIGILTSDGYLFETNKEYRYNSYILKQWCLKHICQ